MTWVILGMHYTTRAMPQSPMRPLEIYLVRFPPYHNGLKMEKLLPHGPLPPPPPLHTPSAELITSSTTFSSTTLVHDYSNKLKSNILRMTGITVYFMIF